MRMLATLVLTALFSGCVHRVQAYNQRVYDQCVAQHHGETWTWNGLPLTCKPLPYPARGNGDE